MHLSEIKSVVIRDSAIDSMCHGAQLAIPGVLTNISSIWKSGDLVGIYSQKGEALLHWQISLPYLRNEIKDANEGICISNKKNNHETKHLSQKIGVQVQLLQKSKTSGN